MKYDLARLLAILSYRTACQLASNAKSGLHRHDSSKQPKSRFERESNPLFYKYKVFCRQATLWNMITCLAKGQVKGDLHAPKAERGELSKTAKARWAELQDWASNHPEQAKKVISPLLAEYEERRKQRELAVA